MWGSDWPVLELAGSYDGWREGNGQTDHERTTAQLACRMRRLRVVQSLFLFIIMLGRTQ
jgi:predicted TIM-barrel fold metal-dependent hydrolase